MGTFKLLPFQDDWFSAAARAWSFALLVVVQLLVLRVDAQFIGSSVYEFTVSGQVVVLYLEPLNFEEAVSSCATSKMLPSQLTLVPFALVPNMFSELLATSPDVAQTVVVAIQTVTQQSPLVQADWDVWAWDEYRACRALTYVFSLTQPTEYFQTSDRPCDWRLTYLCMDENFVLSLGLPSASEWYRTYFAQGAASATAPQPSPYLLGPGGSGLSLVRSGLVVGDPNPPADLTVKFDESDLFWTRGPVLSALYRAPNSKLVTLKLLREADIPAAWGMYMNWSSITDAVGADLIALPPGPTVSSRTNAAMGYEVYAASADSHDYIVAVQGCFRPQELQMLFFITRTGRQYQLGRGGCSSWFREDAPAGGYLAGISGYYMDPALRSPPSTVNGIRPIDMTWINQVQLVWAAPTGAGLPTYQVHSPPAPNATSPRPCPGALPLASSVVQQNAPAACGADFGRVCPSNACCGLVLSLDTSPTTYTTCAAAVATKSACQALCVSGYGMCALPDSPIIQFVRSPPQQPQAVASDGSGASAAAAGTVVYAIKNDTQMSYYDAQSYCANNTYMGLSWSMVTVSDTLDWLTSMDTRRDAYAYISANGYFWVVIDDSVTRAGACMRGGYGLLDGIDRYCHVYVPTDCSMKAVVACRAVADQNTTALVRNSTARWQAGLHVISTSDPLGSGPFGAKPCQSSLGFTSANATSLSDPGSIRSVNSTAPEPPFVNRRITAFGVSVAVQQSNETDPVAVVAAIKLLLSGTGTEQPAMEVAGAVSTDGWHMFELSEGEVVVAVSGCAGGYVERLVLHTSKGRLWTPPFLASSVCSAPFLELPPDGAYLVGLQGWFGDYLESVTLVWGQPAVGPPQALISPSPPPPPALSVLPTPPPPPPPPPQGSSGSSGSIVGLAVGVAVGGAAALALAGLAVWLLLRRRRQRQREAADGVKAATGSGSRPRLLTPGGGGGTNGGAAAAATATVTAAAVVAGSGRSSQPEVAGRVAAAAVGVVVSARPQDGGTDGVTPGDASGGRGVVSSGAAGGSSSSDLNARTATVTSTATPTSGATLATASPAGPVSSAAAPRISDIEQKLGDYIRAGGGTHEYPNARTDAKEEEPAAAGPTRTAIAAAISKLQAELSAGHQEQLRVTALLGKGSSGVVYLGTWRGLQVAVKELVVHDALLGREGRQRRRAILEAAISKSLQNQHVVNTYSTEVVSLAAVGRQVPSDAALADDDLPTSGEAADTEANSSGGMLANAGDVYKLYIIQEYCDGGSLTAALANGVVGSVSSGGGAALCALTLALDVACGMCHIHAKNIVHGDLSASNVLLASCNRFLDGRPEVPYDTTDDNAAVLQRLTSLWRPPVMAKVADFGLSVHMSPRQTHASNHFQGTPAYTSPEVLDRGHLSKAADVWAYGVLLLEFCHGVPIRRIRDLDGRGPQPTAAGASGGQDDAAMAAAGEEPGGDGPPSWAVLPSSVAAAHPLASLIGACLARAPSARPSFSQVVAILAQHLLNAHGQAVVESSAPPEV